MEQQMVVFELSGEQFAVDISAVESIIKMQAITTMPKTPSFVEGITNLRGMILPVIDLKKRLGLESKLDENGSSKDQRRIVVVSVGKHMVGMIVDAVQEVLKVNPEEVSAPPPMVTSINSAFVTGIIKVGGRLIIRLELDQVLSIEESEQIQAMPLI
jgi:purine-binding chemotaxis protein CheW